ncbi:MAG: hypothetical protein ACFBSE_19670 [Prochloraceae cyanobacterium]
MLGESRIYKITNYLDLLTQQILDRDRILVWKITENSQYSFMRSLYAEIEINAPKHLVWQALIVKERWLYWNTFLYDCDRTKGFELGNQVFLSLRRLPRDEETEFLATVIRFEPEFCLKWVSSLPGLRNEQVFQLQEIGIDKTKYLHQDIFSGILTGVFVPFIRQDELKGLRRMARQLKIYVEKNY